MITWDEIMEIEARAEKATPGPWLDDRPFIKASGRPVKPIGQVPEYGVSRTPQDDKNAAFIAHARQDVTTLCGAVRQLKTELQHLKDDYRMARAEVDRLQADNTELHKDWVEALADFEAASRRAETWKKLAKQYRWVLIHHEDINPHHLSMLRRLYFGQQVVPDKQKPF